MPSREQEELSQLRVQVATLEKELSQARRELNYANKRLSRAAAQCNDARQNLDVAFGTLAAVQAEQDTALEQVGREVTQHHRTQVELERVQAELQRVQAEFRQVQIQQEQATTPARMSPRTEFVFITKSGTKWHKHANCGATQYAHALPKDYEPPWCSESCQ